MLVERDFDPTRNLNVNEFLFGRINTATTSTGEQNSATDGSSTMNLSSSNARKLEGKEIVAVVVVIITSNLHNHSQLQHHQR